MTVPVIILSVGVISQEAIVELLTLIPDLSLRQLIYFNQILDKIQIKTVNQR